MVCLPQGKSYGILSAATVPAGSHDTNITSTKELKTKFRFDDTALFISKKIASVLADVNGGVDVVVESA
jgi:hypothetical protein